MQNEWQAIDTAPKDGASVLLYSPVLFGEQIVVAYYELGQWHDLMGRVPQPTHWMPLPKAPKEQQAEGEL